MQKESMAWLIIRSSGVFLLGFALIKVVVFSSAFLYLYTPTIYEGGNTLRLVNIEYSSLFEGMFLLVCSYYFLRHGNLVHRLLMREH